MPSTPTYAPEQAYARGLADLGALSHLLGEQPFLFGAKPHSTDCGAYGFLANSWFYPIETPLKAFIGAGNLAPYCERLHRLVQA